MNDNVLMHNSTHMWTTYFSKVTFVFMLFIFTSKAVLPMRGLILMNVCLIFAIN